MIDLTGKVALVTEAARGVGKTIALRLAEAGADIILNYSSSQGEAEQTAESVAALGRQVAVVRADASDANQVAAMIDFIRDSFGRLDILVSNAALSESRPLLETTAEHFQHAMSTNVRSLLSLVQAALPLLQQGDGRGKVIGLSNPGAEFAMPNLGLLGATKAALESTIRHLALELGPRGINFNVVQAALLETEYPGIVSRRSTSDLIGGRSLEATDVANAVLFLASPLSDLIQGQTLVVDGGAAVAA
jgi:enoyl-[acyl-carrier protein] reductase III